MPPPQDEFHKNGSDFKKNFKKNGDINCDKLFFIFEAGS